MDFAKFSLLQPHKKIANASRIYGIESLPKSQRVKLLREISEEQPDYEFKVTFPRIEFYFPAEVYAQEYNLTKHEIEDLLNNDFRNLSKFVRLYVWLT